MCATLYLTLQLTPILICLIPGFGGGGGLTSGSDRFGTGAGGSGGRDSGIGNSNYVPPGYIVLDHTSSNGTALDPSARAGSTGTLSASSNTGNDVNTTTLPCDTIPNSAAEW